MKKLILLKALLGLTIMASGHAFAENYYGTTGDDFADNQDNDYSAMYGYKGNDEMWGGEYGDTIYGGKHQDFIFGNMGEDKLWGQAGNDHIDSGYPQADFLRERMGGGIGNDTCYAAPTDFGNMVVTSCESRTESSLNSIYKIGEGFN